MGLCPPLSIRKTVLFQIDILVMVGSPKKCCHEKIHAMLVRWGYGVTTSADVVRLKKHLHFPRYFFRVVMLVGKFSIFSNQ